MNRACALMFFSSLALVASAQASEKAPPTANHSGLQQNTTHDSIESTPLSPYRLATRLSFALRRAPPDKTDIVQLEAAFAQGPEMYLNSFRDLRERYLKSSLFLDTLVDFYATWWNIPRLESAFTAAHETFNEQPFSKLFDSSVIYLNSEREAKYLAAQAAFANSLPPQSLKFEPVKLGTEENRFRSVLERLDFLDTNPDTATNLNRKRSKQVFERILCLQVAPDNVSDEVLQRPTGAPDDHVSDKTCARCHYKLDPLARVFDRWRAIPAGELSSPYDPAYATDASLFLFDSQSQNLSETKVSDPTELARSIASSPFTRSCVSSKLWAFFARQSKIPQDFVAAAGLELVAHDNLLNVIRNLTEYRLFWSSATPEPLVYGDVETPLQKCASCHLATPQSINSGADAPPISFQSYPWMADRERNKNLLKNVWKRVNSQGADMMPPADLRQIALGQNELDLLREWISLGARANNKEASLDAKEIAEILGNLVH